MSKGKLIVLGVIAAVLVMVSTSSLFVVHQAAQAIVLQFGEAKRVVRDPGLNVKLPWIQNVIYYDKRVLDLDPPTEEVILADQKRINVDAFARYRIVDPLRFFQSVQNELVLRDRFGKTLNSSVRAVLGNRSLPQLLSPERDGIMQTIRERMTESATTYGIEVIDVRIGRTELPAEISKNVYDRMRSHREREANKLRAEGEEIKQRITAEADRQRTVIVAEARKTSNIQRGEGDAQRNRVLGEAFGRDPEFFSFLRSLEAYRGALNNDTTMVLSPDSEFFRFFRSGANPRNGTATGSGN